MNCISPWAPAELVWLLRPCPVSSMPIPASSVHGILYLVARRPRTASRSWAGMGSGGLCSESCRGAAGLGQVEPDPALPRVGVDQVDRCDRRLASGRGRRCRRGGRRGRHERDRVDRCAVDVRPGSAGGCRCWSRSSLRPRAAARRRPGRRAGCRRSMGRGARTGADPAAVVEGDDVPVGASRAGGGRRCRRRRRPPAPPAGMRGEVLAGVQPPLVVDGMEPAPERRGQDVPGERAAAATPPPPPTAASVSVGAA